MKAIEKGIYSDGEVLEIRPYHPAWGMAKPVARMPLDRLAEARRCVDEIKRSTVHEVDDMVRVWQAQAREMMEEIAQEQPQSGKKRKTRENTTPPPDPLPASSEGEEKTDAPERIPTTEGERALLEAVRVAKRADERHKDAMMETEIAKKAEQMAAEVADTAWKVVERCMYELRGE